MKAKAEWTARTEEPVVASSASKRDKVMGIGSSAKHQGQRSYKTALTGRRHDCTRPAKLKHCLNHLAKRAPSRHDHRIPTLASVLPCNFSIMIPNPAMVMAVLIQLRNVRSLAALS